jgi:hypothetical protein
MQPKAKVFLACFLAGLLLSPVAMAEVVKQLSLDDPGALGTVIEKDSSLQKVKIKTLWPTTICLGEVTGLNVEKARLLYQAKVKSNLIEGTAYLEMWCQVDGANYFSRGKNSVVKGSSDWKLLETPFFLQKGQKTNRVTLNLVVEGRGTVWIDEVTLARTPLK